MTDKGKRPAKFVRRTHQAMAPIFNSEKRPFKLELEKKGPRHQRKKKHGR